ncbi:3'-5' exonuclease [Curvibacter sp. APW13]|uniref:3'-5' exonuclease n=1 Tax=Curvibacter sp. APW13 TaxID=3077236 RepID=UPI0028DD5B7D|nr:3'-5' exonuclease [Curvibacter sp. APW13]MDT8991670.1 3'-5' exonuclease [Curvibacter sp. APW13]
MQQDHFSSELFPELRVPASAAVPRARKSKSAPPKPQTTVVPAQGKALPSTPSLPLPAPSTSTDFEQLASILDAHPDFRVLRRLQPCLDWPVRSEGKTLQVVLLDTETTGLDHGRDRIIELAMLRFTWNPATALPEGPVQVFDQLEDPGFPIPADAQRITGITDGEVQGKRMDDAAITTFLTGVDLVIAHNAGFDRPFAERRIPVFASLPWACSFADLDWKALEESSAKLESLALSLGLFYDAHRAETDCHALLRVLVEPRAQLQGSNGLALLAQAAQLPAYRVQAVGAPFEAKDLLKARAYRWNAENKVWSTTLTGKDALVTECHWLRDEVYRSRSASVRVEELDARVKYSHRAGTERWIRLSEMEV